ncbi:MAG: hypothetical protein ACPG4T_02800 [Nannocystaceae bacterium]
MPRTFHILILASCCITGCKDGGEGGSASDSSDPPTSTAGPESGSSGENEPTTTTGELETTESSGTGATSGSTTNAETTTTGDTSTTGGAVCSNGVIEGDEECDNAQLSYNGPCLPGCFLNVCGDGHQNFEAESCDEGDQNGMYSVMCGPDCQLDGGQFCGDGLVQEAHEDCEPGEVHDEFDIECQDCVWTGYRIVFVTSVAFDGSMEGGGLDNEDGLSGVTLADYRCQQLANNEGLPGTYHAWLSDNNDTEISNAADRIGGAGLDVSYRMRNGGIVAPSWSALLADGPDKQILFTEEGFDFDNMVRVWTNTTDIGDTLGEFDCNGWTNSSLEESGSVGLTVTGPLWTDANEDLRCIYKYHLYCFQGEE